MDTYKMTLVPRTLEDAEPEARSLLEGAQNSMEWSPTCTPGWPMCRMC